MPISTPARVTQLPDGPSASRNAACRVEIDLAAGEVQFIDVSAGDANSSIVRIESVYVDNTRGISAVVIQFSDTRRLLIVPPGAEGCYDAFTRGTSFSIGQADPVKGLRARLILFACHRVPFERFPGAWGVIECPLDVDSNPGFAGAGGFKPRRQVASGWNLAFAGPRVVISGNRIDVNASAVTVNWNAPSKPDLLLFAEMTFEHSADSNDNAIGLVTNTFTQSGYARPANQAIAVHFNSNTWNGGDQVGGDGSSVRNTTIGVALDGKNKAVNFYTNGVLIRNNTYYAPGMDLRNFVGLLYLATFNAASGVGGCTMNSLGPFAFPPPAGYIPWDFIP